MSLIAPSVGRVGPAIQSGMHGGVHLRAELIAGRTRITDLACRPPLQVLRAHHLDRARPDLASVILASPAGGILQGDRLTIDIRVGPGATLRVATQSATRLYRACIHASTYAQYALDPDVADRAESYRALATAVAEAKERLAPLVPFTLGGREAETLLERLSEIQTGAEEALRAP